MLKVEDKIAQEIGYLVFAFNSLEDCVDTVLFEVLHPRTNEIGKIVTERDSFTKKLTLLKKMFEHFLEASGEEKGKQELSELVGKVRSANAKRNNIIHAAWEEYFYDQLQDKVRIKWNTTKGKVSELGIKADPESIRKTKEEIERLNELLFDFHEEYFCNQ